MDARMGEGRNLPISRRFHPASDKKPSGRLGGASSAAITGQDSFAYRNHDVSILDHTTSSAMLLLRCHHISSAAIQPVCSRDIENDVESPRNQLQKPPLKGPEHGA